jgi:chemotaxis protein MotA
MVQDRRIRKVDISTILGIVLGFGFVFLAIFLGGSMNGFINGPSIMITVGGTFSALLITYPLSNVKKVGQVVKNAFFEHSFAPNELIQRMVAFSHKARREGLLALEKECEEIDDDFLRNGIELVVDGTEPDLIQSILGTELTNIENRHALGAQLFSSMAEYAPAFGMIGTLVGLVQMLRAMDDPSAIGPGMAVALLTTLYGSIMANLIFNPIAGKLTNKSSEEALLKQLAITGILSIQSGDNPRVLEQKLMSYLAPNLRESEEPGGKKE